MRVARTIATLTAAAAMALGMLLQAFPVAAVSGYDASYQGESDFININPGESKQFSVIFRNTGTTSWQTGTSSQVDLATCCPWNSAPQWLSWRPGPGQAGDWLSNTAYATPQATFTGPNTDATFQYNVRAPSNSTTGIYRFSGDLTLHSTLDMIHPVGYYQEANVSATASTPVTLTVTPSTQTKVVGTTATVTATVRGPIPTGSTQGPVISGVNVTFIVDACPHQTDSCGLNIADNNPDLIMTATTDSNGQAVINYTRQNPGNDRIDAYVTSIPAVRGSGNVLWGVAQAITVNPKDAVSLANDTCPPGAGRTYTVVQKNPQNGLPGQLSTSTAATVNVDLYANFVENFAGAGDLDGGATIAGTSPTDSISIILPAGSFDATGTRTVVVCGAGSTKTTTLVVFDNASNTSLTAIPNTNPNLIDPGDRSDTGGSITWIAKTPTFTLTPLTSATAATGAQRVYTILAKDQFGNPWTTVGGATIGFVECTDNLTTTNTRAGIIWHDTSATPSTSAKAGFAKATAATQDSTTYTLADCAPSATAIQVVTITLNSTGGATFAIGAGIATTGTPVVWWDKVPNLIREIDEPQATGGPTTFVTAALTSCTLKVDKATAATSPTPANTAGTGPGIVTYTFAFADQSANPFSVAASSTVKYTVTNTGAGAVVVDSTNTALASGATITVTHTFAAPGSSDTLKVDSSAAGSVSVTATGTAGTTTVSCGPTTNTWILVNAEPGSGQVTGTVVAVDNGTGGNDGEGTYILQTALSGNFLISFSAIRGDVFFIIGTGGISSPTDGTTFEKNLAVGGTVQWSFGPPHKHDLQKVGP